jgi:hypothetical protein
MRRLPRSTGAEASPSWHRLGPAHVPRESEPPAATSNPAESNADHSKPLKINDVPGTPSAMSRHITWAHPKGFELRNLLIRRHGPMMRPGTIRVLLSCRWKCREA